MKKRLFLLSFVALLTGCASVNGATPNDIDENSEILCKLVAGSESSYLGDSASKSEDGSLSSEKTIDSPSDAPSSTLPENETTSSESLSPQIFVSKNIPPEIEIGHSVDLNDYIAVFKADSYSFVSANENIEIVGHTIKGLRYGEFSVRIVAGDSEARYSGYVVSSDKIAFNEKIAEIKNNYTVRWFSGSSNSLCWQLFCNDQYFLYSYPLSSSRYWTNDGYLDAIDGHTYRFSVDGDNIYVQPGYQLKIANYYWGTDLSSLPLKGSDFVEVLDNGLDPKPTGEYKMIDRKTYPSSSNDDLVDTFSLIVGPQYVNSLRSRFDTYVATLILDEEGSSIRFLPTNYKDDLRLCFLISDIGSTSVDEVEEWLDDPVYPEPYDISSVSDVFERMNTGKNYTVRSIGNWVNTSFVSVSDNVTSYCNESSYGMFFDFDVTSFVTENIYYSRLDSIAHAEAYGSKAWKEGETSGAFVKDNKFYTAKGLFTDDLTSWETPIESSDIIATEGGDLSIWDSDFGSSYFSGDNFKKANCYYFGSNSYYERYFFNCLGEDSGKLIEKAMAQIGCSIGDVLYSNYFSRSTKQSVFYFDIYTDGDFVFAAYLPWQTDSGATYYYFVRSIYSNIGSTSIPEGANTDSLLSSVSSI